MKILYTITKITVSRNDSDRPSNQTLTGGGLMVMSREPPRLSQ